MRDNKALITALDIMNKKDHQQKAGVQGNIFRRILNYLGIDEDEYVLYEEVCNGKAVDCLITINSVRLPVYIINYSKDKRGDVHYLNEQIKSYESLLKQFLIANRLPLGVITNGYTLIFFELTQENELKRLRNIWISNVVKNLDEDDEDDNGNSILSDKDFLEQYSFDEICKTFEQYLDLELLDTFVNEHIVNISEDLLDWVNQKLEGRYPLIALENSINKLFFNKILEEKREGLKETKIVRIEKEVAESLSKDEILKSDLSQLEKLKGIVETPVLCSIVDEKIIEFTAWRDFFVSVLEFAINKDENVYNNFANQFGNRVKFSIIKEGTDIYSHYLSNKNYRKLSNNDLVHSSMDRVKICSLSLELLKMLKIENPFITIVYQDNTSLSIEENNDGYVEDLEDFQFQKDNKSLNIRKLLYSQDVSEEILNGIRDDSFTQYSVYGRTFDLKNYTQLVEGIVNSTIIYDIPCYRKIKELDLGSRFFILTPEREKNVQYYHKVRTLVNGDKYVFTTSGEECIYLVYLLLSFSNREDNKIKFF